MPTGIGRRTVFGHRCLVVGATVGDLCEIGNASILMPGSRLGDRVFLGEGTLVAPGTDLPSDVVAVGRPARVIRAVSEADLNRLRGLRGGDLTLPPHTFTTIQPALKGLGMGQLYDYRGVTPSIAASAVLFPTAEITGDVVIGEAQHHRCRSKDHRRLPWPSPDRRRCPNPREHCVAPTARQPADNRGRRHRRTRRHDPRLSYRCRLGRRARCHRVRWQRGRRRLPRPSRCRRQTALSLPGCC